MAKDPSSNWWVFPGFSIETVLAGLDLPANISFVPHPKAGPKDPLLYINELYGQVKVMTNDGSVFEYASGLLNYDPDYKFPGTGESGLTGLCVEPLTGDLFLSMLYVDKKKFKAKVIRTTSATGLSMDSSTVILENVPSVHAAHQVQAVSIGFDGKLYVNFGDGMIDSNTAQDDNDLRGKVLRLELDGSVPDDNPTPGSPVFAKGFRNPFGAFWRKSDGHLYITDNGPHVDDRVARVEAGGNYGWPATMRQGSLMWWHFCQAPTAITFMENGQFSADFDDEMFVALFGSAYVMGRPVNKGKKIIKMKLNDDDTAIKSYDEFVTYNGEGPAGPCGLAFGPDGLYFTDLHGEFSGGKRSTGHLFLVKPNVT
jgi:aldose sugar dehydrogenase